MKIILTANQFNPVLKGLDKEWNKHKDGTDEAEEISGLYCAIDEAQDSDAPVLVYEDVSDWLIRVLSKIGQRPLLPDAKNFLVLWPNGTFSVVAADTNLDLAQRLDLEGNYDDAKIYILPANAYVSTDVERGKIVVQIACGEEDLCSVSEAVKEGWLKRHKCVL